MMAGAIRTRVTKAERPTRLFNAAARVLKEREFGNLRLSDVSDIVRVQPAALYNCFSSKEALMRRGAAEAVALG